jgi:hypothetical protein
VSYPLEYYHFMRDLLYSMHIYIYTMYYTYQTKMFTNESIITFISWGGNSPCVDSLLNII